MRWGASAHNFSWHKYVHIITTAENNQRRTSQCVFILKDSVTSAHFGALTCHDSDSGGLVSKPSEESQADVLLHSLPFLQHAQNVLLWRQGKTRFFIFILLPYLKKSLSFFGVIFFFYNVLFVLLRCLHLEWHYITFSEKRFGRNIHTFQMFLVLTLRPSHLNANLVYFIEPLPAAFPAEKCHLFAHLIEALSDKMEGAFENALPRNSKLYVNIRK